MPHTNVLMWRETNVKVGHRPYSLDLLLCDYHLFGALNEALTGQLENDEDVKNFVSNCLQARSFNFDATRIKILFQKYLIVTGNYIEELIVCT